MATNSDMCDAPPCLDDVAVCCRILGALLYYPPDHAELAPVLDLIRRGELAQMWPFAESAEVQRAAAQMQAGLSGSATPQALRAAYQRLFVGPHHLEAPPWASVYLEQEGTLFGESTQALRTLLAGEGIRLSSGEHEPEDHIGLLCWAAALLAEDGRTQALRRMLDNHLLNWAGTYFARLMHAARHPFYRGVASLATSTLGAIGADFRHSAADGEALALLRNVAS